MSFAPRVYAREIIPQSLLMDSGNIEDAIKRNLASMIAAELFDKVEFRKYNDPNSHDVIVEASLIAMNQTEFDANFGSHHQRRGIADGTMAVLVNGNWKVLGTTSTPSLNSIRPTPKSIEQEPPKKVSATEYLTNKVTELRS